jgi:hypothetical protein
MSLLGKLHKLTQERLDAEAAAAAKKADKPFGSGLTLKASSESREKDANDFLPSGTELARSTPARSVETQGTTAPQKGSFLARFAESGKKTDSVDATDSGDRVGGRASDTMGVGSGPILSTPKGEAPLSTEVLTATEINAGPPTEIESLKDFATLNTDGIDARNNPASLAETQIAQIKGEMLLSGPANIRVALDEVDSLMTKDVGINTITLGVIRNKIESVMVSLRDNPEWDSIMLDKDVHNVIRFLRSVRGEAQLEREQKVAKKAVRPASPKRAGKTLSLGSFDLKSFAASRLLGKKDE